MTDEELIEEVMNNSNGEDEEDDDAIDVLGPVCPKASDAQDKMQVFCVTCTIEHVKSVWGLSTGESHTNLDGTSNFKNNFWKSQTQPETMFQLLW